MLFLSILFWIFIGFAALMAVVIYGWVIAKIVRYFIDEMDLSIFV